MSPKLRISARALIGDEERLVMCWNKAEAFYFLPGGGLEPMEDLRTCLARELKEEMNVEAQVGDFVGCIENHWQDVTQTYQEFCFIFRVTAPAALLTGKLRSNEPHIAFEILPIAQLLCLDNVLPTQLRPFLAAYYNYKSVYMLESQL